MLAEKVVPRQPTTVEIDNEVSEDYTVIDVFTRDRVGILFAIANALYHLGLSIHLAKITTNVDQVLRRLLRHRRRRAGRSRTPAPWRTSRARSSKSCKPLIGSAAGG